MKSPEMYEHQFLFKTKKCDIFGFCREFCLKQLNYTHIYKTRSAIIILRAIFRVATLRNIPKATSRLENWYTFKIVL